MTAEQDGRTGCWEKSERGHRSRSSGGEEAAQASKSKGTPDLSVKGCVGITVLLVGAMQVLSGRDRVQKHSQGGQREWRSRGSC